MLFNRNLIILIGFMGTGKSTVGKLIAKKIGFAFVDLDKLIENEAGLKISEIFERYGEEYFRDLEKQAVNSLKTMDKTVVATGGGVVLDPQNMAVMKEVGIVIALDADIETLWKRLKSSRNRPLIKSSDPKRRIEDLYHKRRLLYSKAHCIVDTSGKSIEAVAQDILKNIFE
jgi:shikimate kinase